jgi:ribonuclease Z
MDITILGTAGSTPTKNRMMPGVALTYEGDTVLFDCGEGTQMQMLKYGINGFGIKCIFISHAHGDHIIGIAGLLRSLALNNRKEPLKIFIPEGYEEVVRSLIVFDKALINYKIDVIGIRGGVVYKGKGFRISAFRLSHTILTYGFVFKEEDKLRFIKEKCAKIGIKGAMFSELQRRKRIKVNGKIINISDVTKLQRGRKIVYASDTRPSVNTIRAAADADLLIHEATYNEDHKDLAISRKHSTAIEAARVAKKSGSKRLILCHFSARYKNVNGLLKDARSVFRNTILANDGYKIVV